MVKLGDYDCIGFDLDHTVIQYKLENLYELIYKSLTEFLVKEKGYDACLLDGTLDDYKDFILRGLIFDIEKGNILKLDKNGIILRASHGTNPMSQDEIKEFYGKNKMFLLFDQLKESLSTRHRYICFRTFENFFDLPGVLIAARLVDIIDKKQGRQEKYSFWSDVMAGLTLNLSPSSFIACKGGYFPTITKNPEKYIKPCSSELVNWIKSLRKKNRKVFLLTNSYIDYVNFLMKNAIGKDWQSMFDIVLCKASKPGFFVPFKSGKVIPFYEVDGEEEIHTAEELHMNKVYSQGNNETFMKHVKIWTGKDEPRILYFGDSAKSDIYPTCTLAKWDVAAVLEEMETEGMVTLHHPQQDDVVEDGPRRKRAKLVDINVEEGKEAVLLSNQWGSLFTDDTQTTNAPGGVVNHVISETMKETPEIVSTEFRKMNTFWGDLIRRCSTIAIPTIDFITSLPDDYEFGTFDATHSGFYPGVPKSLYKA